MAAMFNQRPKGLFGNMGQQASAPPVAQQTMPPQGMAMPQQEAAAAAPKRPGFNDPGGWGERLYNIGGIMRDNDNGQTMANYQQLQMQRSREAQAAQQATQDRENQWADWVKRETYKRDNPDQAAPSEFERMLANAGIQPGTPEYIEANRRAAMSKGDPFVTASLPGGQFFAGPQSAIGSVMGGGQQGAGQGGLTVGTVRNGFRYKGGNPNDQGSWEPAAQGGPASQAPGGFLP